MARRYYNNRRMVGMAMRRNRYKRRAYAKRNKGILPMALGWYSSPMAKAGVTTTSTRWWFLGLASAGLVGKYFPTALNYLQTPVDWVSDKAESLVSNLGVNFGSTTGSVDEESEDFSFEDLGGDVAELFNTDNYA